MSDPVDRLNAALEGRYAIEAVVVLPAGNTVRIPISQSELTALIERAQEEGISRRQLMKLFAVGGISAVLAACERPPASGGASGGTESGGAESPWLKSPDPFIEHPTNLETRLELLDGVITPNELFFVRNHAPTPRIDATAYRLRVEGDAVNEPVELTMDDLRALPSRSVVA